MQSATLRVSYSSIIHDAQQLPTTSRRTSFRFFDLTGRAGVGFARRWRSSATASPATSFMAGSSPAFDMLHHAADHQSFGKIHG